MQIVASSLQKTGEFFLHAGYLSAPNGILESTSYPLAPYCGGTMFIVCGVLAYCMYRNWIGRRTAFLLGIGAALLLALVAHYMAIEIRRYPLETHPVPSAAP